MDDLLLALADPHRRAMLDRLRRGPAAAGELGEGLPMSQPAVSRHLRVLRDAGLVAVEQDGRRRVYSLRPDGLADVETWLAPYRDLWLHRLDALSTEIARGRRAARGASTDPTATRATTTDPATITDPATTAAVTRTQQESA